MLASTLPLFRNTKIQLWLATVVITLFLFFIDEGFNNFHWMADGGNWVAFVIYISLIFSCQLLAYWLLRKLNISRGAIGLSVVTGTILALCLAFFVIFT